MRPPALPRSVIKAIPVVTRAAVNGVLEAMDEKWAINAYGFQQRIEESIAAGDYNAANRWTWCAGVTTDKLLVLRGRPTEIIANLHAHRVDLSPIMDKLATSARVLDQHRRKGYAEASPSSTEVVKVITSTPVE